MANDPDDELELEVDAPAGADLEDEGLDTDEQGEPAEAETPPPDQAAPQGDQQQQQDRQPEPPARAATRGENRFQTLRNDNQRLDRELAETRRRLDEITRTMQRPAGETPESRAQRHALMTPQEIMQESLRESEARMAQQLQTMQMQNFDVADRTAFQAKAASDPVYAKYGPKVEGKLAEMRARGQNAERDVILKFLIGEAALERRGSKEGRREVQQAAQRVRAQRVRPANSGSDTQTERRQQSSVERRLENVQI
jgi:hypothetical protein